MQAKISWSGLTALLIFFTTLVSTFHPANAAPPAQCLAGTSPGTGSAYVVCSADTTSAWVSANTGGSYAALAICQALGYSTVTAYGGTCGTVCGYCQGGTSCASPGNQTFDGGGAVSLAALNGGGLLGNTVHWKCGGYNAAATSVDKTILAISKFVGRRNDLMASNGPSMSRQIDRLEQAGGSGGSTSAGLASQAPVRVVENSANGGSNRAASASRTGSDTMTSAVLATATQVGGLAAQPDGIGTAPLGLADARSGDGDATPVGSFQTSLAQLADASDRAESRRVRAALGSDPMALGAGPLSPLHHRPKAALDVWAEGHFASFTDQRGGFGSEGHFGVVYLGTDYVVAPGLLIGALVQHDNMTLRSASASSEVSGQGWMAGPYATVKLTDRVYLQGRAAWGKSDNEVSPLLTYTDRFNSQRWLAAAKLSGAWDWGPWQFRPSASLDYIEDKTGAYIDSTNQLVPGIKATLGQIKAGPELGYRFQGADGTSVTPRVGVLGVWNFDAGTHAGDFGGTLAGPEGLRGRVELGLTMRVPSGVSVDLTGSYDGVGTGSFEAYTGSAVVRIPLN